LYIDSITYQSILKDTRDFIKARMARHGKKFTTHEALISSLQKSIIVKNGSKQIGEVQLDFKTFGESESESHLIVSIPSQQILFCGDLVNFNVPAIPFESITNWYRQLDILESTYRQFILYQGHGQAPTGIENISQQREYFDVVKLLVNDLTKDGLLTQLDIQSGVSQLDIRYPDYTGVAGNNRNETFTLVLKRAAKQLGKIIENE